MRQVTKIVFASVLAGVVLAGCSSKKDSPGSEPRYSIREQCWNASWLASSNISMWQTYTTDKGPQSIHSNLRIDLLITPAGHDPNGNLLVAVSFKRMEVANNEVIARSDDPLTDEEAAVSDANIAKGSPYTRIGMVKVLREVCKTTILCRVTPQGDVQYLSGDDLDVRAGGTIPALGNPGLLFKDSFCTQTAVDLLKGHNDILPQTPVGDGARWHLTTTDLSVNTEGLQWNIPLRIKGITESGGRRIANIVFSTKAGEDIKKAPGAARSRLVVTSRQFSVSGRMEFDLDKKVCRTSTITEKGKIIAEVDGVSRLKRYTRDVTTTLTEAPAAQ